VLEKVHRRAGVRVHISVAFDDDEISKIIEPGAPRPSLRFRVMEELSKVGIPVSVALAPVIPGLNDSAIPAILTQARERGADSAFMTLVRLPGAVRDVFVDRITRELPTRASKIINAIKEVRDGKLNNSTFGKRMAGTGARWDAVEWMFESTCQRLGLNTREDGADVPTPRAPRNGRQLSLPL
jgi:DNA repair photolyase